MAHKVLFRIAFKDVQGEDRAIVTSVEIHPGETREKWTADVIKNGFRMNLMGKDDKDFKGKDFARRIAPNRILAVDYEVA
jgi:hypothetical protein